MGQADNGDVWTIRGVSRETRQLFKDAADANDIPVGAFADLVLRQEACRVLNIPTASVEETGRIAGASQAPRTDAAVDELAKRVAALERRLTLADSETGAEEREELRGDELLLRLLYRTRDIRLGVHERFMVALMETLRQIDDPVLSRDVQGVVQEFKKGAKWSKALERIRGGRPDRSLADRPRSPSAASSDA